MSDVLNVLVTVPRHRGASADGAFMALTGADDVADRHRVAETIEPNPDIAAAHEVQHRPFTQISDAPDRTGQQPPTTSHLDEPAPALTPPSLIATLISRANRTFRIISSRTASASRLPRRR